MNNKNYLIRPYRKGDEKQIVLLFSEVFGKNQVNKWHWKFDNEKGEYYGILAEIKGELVGQYTGFARNIYIKGKMVESIQICDVMIRKSERGQYGKSGIFMEMLNKFIAMHIESEENSRFTYGFPSERHYKLGKKLGIYEKISTLYKYTNSPPKNRKNEKYLGIEEIKGNVSLLPIVDRLWKGMLKDYADGIIGERNSKYFKWRYLDNPGRDYIYLQLINNFTRKVLGISIVTVVENVAILVDCFCRKKYLEYLLVMSEKFIDENRKLNAFSIFLSENEHTEFCNKYYDTRVKYLTIPRIINYTAKYKPVSETRGNVFVLIGDSDLV